MSNKKLIEVALPLEAINAAAKREKSIRHGHPSTLHLWWARRPLAAARAVIWSSLVDDPSSHPEQFPTEDAQAKERDRLFKILEALVVWENSNDENVLNAARDEIRKSVGDDLPEFLDPFAGGGAIPLEAQRLGLKAHAHDLNPVAVMINKAMIEIPPMFAGMPPVNPRSRRNLFDTSVTTCKVESNDENESLEFRIQNLEFSRGYNESSLPRAESLAKSNGNDSRDIPSSSSSSQRGDLWNEVTDNKSRCINSIQHCRGMDKGIKQGKETISFNCSRLSCRNGNTTDSLRTDRVVSGTTHRKSSSFNDRSQQNAQFSEKQVSGQLGFRIQNLEFSHADTKLNPNQLNPKSSNGLAEDVQYYGNWLKEEAFKRIGHLYPKVKIPSPNSNGQEATVIAWIWARTVKCPNPACGCQMPLVRSWELSKKKGKEAYIEPIIDKTNKKIHYIVKNGNDNIPESPKLAHGCKFKCICCNETVGDDYVKNEGMNGRLGHQLLAIVAEGNKGRLYLSPNDTHIKAAQCDIPDNIPIGKIGDDRRSMFTPLYGLTNFSDLFTPRQLTALTTFSDLIPEVYEKVLEDCEKAGFRIQDLELSDVEPKLNPNSLNPKSYAKLNPNSQNPKSYAKLNPNSLNPKSYAKLNPNPLNPKSYARAIATYLAFVVDKLADRNSSICSWDCGCTKIRNTFGRQAIPMTWDYAEANIFCDSSGSFDNSIKMICDVILRLPSNNQGLSNNYDAQTDCGLRNLMISTDPPYYDNIGYADLSDYFYVWMRRSLRQFYPDIFKTILVPKAEELVATPYRFDGSKEKAKSFFEDGMFHTCEQLYKYNREDIPVTIYYAYKQSDNKENDKTSSSGWETMLSAIVKAGFQITGTWPLETEQSIRSIAKDTNALASSIVLVCRKRPQDAPVCSLRDFQKALSKELRPALEKMQSSSIAPVDLAQSAIGPGMAVFSRYSAVLRSDDTPVTIREALELINKEIDIVFNEQDQAFDAETRFCLTVFSQYGFNDMKFGEANTLANAKNTSVERVAALGAIHSAKGTVYLYPIDELPSYERSHAECIWTLTHQLIKTIMADGVSGCIQLIVQNNISFNLIHCKELSYRLYTACERAQNAKLAIGYNTLVTSWDEIMRGVGARQSAPKQGKLGL